MVRLFATVLLALTSPSALILEGATVYVSADASAQRSSILIEDGKIAFVGDGEIARRKAPRASRIDLTGTFVFPGLADAHGHLEGLGKSLEIADLRGARDAAEAARRIGAGAEKLPAGLWAEGRGWDQNLWGGHFPDARDLDAFVSERPVVARRIDGHAIWVNSAALRAAGIDRTTRDPEGGRLLRRADGSPSGVLIDTANALVERSMPAPSPADFERRLLAATEACARVGLTEVEDASAYRPEDIALLEKLAARHELPIRVYATVGTGGGSRQTSYEGGRSPAPDTLALFFQKGVHIGRGDDFLTVRAIKTYADGALGSRGAALLADYSDEPGNRGWLITSSELLDSLARRARQHGWQLWVHAIGDRGNRVALDAFAGARAAIPKADPGGDRPRIEHAQVIAASDIPRFGQIGVIASIQPTHATSDMPWAEQRVGPDRIQGAYAWRRLINAGARLAGG
ncbi:MAG TPA: amidohydrolase, partial [Thermoanaerobaculia bacterium]|nr:amidohydrolase [Thermoanaerobaculia bacterium]